MQLPLGTIKAWSQLEREFLSHFFEDDTVISIHSLLATKLEKNEIVKSFVECFHEMSVRCPHGMSQEVLLEACKKNFQTKVLIKMGAVESKTWKELVK